MLDGISMSWPWLRVAGVQVRGFTRERCAAKPSRLFATSARRGGDLLGPSQRHDDKPSSRIKSLLQRPQEKSCVGGRSEQHYKNPIQGFGVAAALALRPNEM
jgi:hypothetical protein